MINFLEKNSMPQGNKQTKKKKKKTFYCFIQGENLPSSEAVLMMFQ